MRVASRNIGPRSLWKTQPSHGLRSVHWDLADGHQQLVPDGTYRVVVELAENVETSVVTRVAFDKGPNPLVIHVAETPQFGAISLSYH